MCWDWMRKTSGQKKRKTHDSRISLSVFVKVGNNEVHLFPDEFQEAKMKYCFSLVQYANSSFFEQKIAVYEAWFFLSLFLFDMDEQ